MGIVFVLPKIEFPAFQWNPRLQRPILSLLAQPPSSNPSLRAIPHPLDSQSGLPAPVGGIRCLWDLSHQLAFDEVELVVFPGDIHGDSLDPLSQPQVCAPYAISHAVSHSNNQSHSAQRPNIEKDGLSHETRVCGKYDRSKKSFPCRDLLPRPFLPRVAS